MKRYCYYLIISFTILFSLSSIHGQNVSISFPSFFKSVDSLPFSISIEAKDSIYFPTKTAITKSDEVFTFIQYFIEVKTRLGYRKVVENGYVNYIPAHLLMNLTKSNSYFYEFDLASKIIKNKKDYRIRFLIRFDRFNEQMNKYVSGWHFFKIKVPFPN